MTTALRTESVSKVYNVDAGTIKAVDQISLGVAPGEFVALVGPSGSGKTTLLAILAGLLVPTSGQVVIDGQDLGRLDDNQRARFRREHIGFAFQANNLVPYLSALENVELMLRLNGQFDRAGRIRARALLQRLGLGDRLNNLPSQLSGGQQQRVAIARALVHNPQLVLVDEPTASLDTERAYQVVDAFASLIQEQNRAGIMVTHDLRMCQYTSKVIQMIDGTLARVIEDRAEIQSLATASGLEAAPLNRQQGPGLPNRPAVPRLAPAWQAS
jgi:putative ABC transport system ATP-binding protein